MKKLSLKIFISTLLLCLFPLTVVQADTAEKNDAKESLVKQNDAEQNSTAALIKKLQSGGYIMYMRHGKTVRKQANRNKKAVDFTDCKSQRNLSSEGFAQVKVIGQAIKTLNIPIGTVLSSPYCRTKDTAKHVFGDFSVDDNLAFSIGKVPAESKRLGKHLLNLMLAVNNQQENTVFVGHTANLKDGLGVWPKPEGVVVVFKKTNEKINYLGMIYPEQWTEYKLATLSP